MNKVLTVSIAAYNVGKYLAETLESLVSSVLSELDIIIVNDGSTDDTSSVAHAYEKKYPDSIRVIDKRNGGYGSTFNAALELARGKYFRYLDGDDWLNSALLPSYVFELANSDADAVITPYVRVFTGESYREETVDDVSELPCGEYRADEVIPCSPVAACSLAYKTSVLKKSNFRMSEKLFYTDVEFAYLPWSRVSTYMVVKLPIYRYRLGRAGQSVSRKGITAHYQDLCAVCSRLIEELDKSEYRACKAQKYIESCCVREAVTVYGFICIAKDDSKARETLAEWDSYLRRYDGISKQVEKRSKLVRFLRLTKMYGYPFAAWIKGRETSE